MKTTDIGLLLLVPLVALGMLAAAGNAQEASCQHCHYQNDRSNVAAGGEADLHLQDFRTSNHAAAGVSCQDCHGGDGTAFDRDVAHRGTSNSNRPGSQTHFSKLSATCGACHSTISAAFEESAHSSLLLAGDSRAPVCTTCHGTVASAPQVPAARNCAVCHSADPDSEAPALSGQGGELLAQMRDVGVLKRKVQTKLNKVKDPARAHDAEEAFHLADSNFQEAAEAGHAFEWTDWETLIQKSRAGFEVVLKLIKGK